MCPLVNAASLDPRRQFVGGAPARSRLRAGFSSSGGVRLVIALIGTRQPQTADERWHEGWVQPTFLTAFTVGCTHPTPAPSSPCELRSTASCWPCSRFSARGPGWPACPQRAGNANGLKLAARESAIGRDSKPARWAPRPHPHEKAGRETRGKSSRRARKIGAEWRFFKGQSASFAVLAAEVPQMASRQ